MMHILKIEWLKLRKYRAFIVLLILTAAGIFGINYIMYAFTGRISNMIETDPSTATVTSFMIGSSPFGFPEVFHSVSYISGFMQMLLGLLMILLIGNESSFRTNRQNVIDGLRRTDLLTGKASLSVVLALWVNLIMFLAACVFGWTTGGAGFSMPKPEYIGYFFVQSLSYMSVAMVTAMLIKRTGVGVVIYFIYAFVIENILSAVINKFLHPGWGVFLPLKSADKLIDPPTMIGKAFTGDLPGKTYLLIAAIIWIVLCLWFCGYRFRKRDL